jgi:hypothetical protein
MELSACGAGLAMSVSDHAQYAPRSARLSVKDVLKAAQTCRLLVNHSHCPRLTLPN